VALAVLVLAAAGVLVLGTREALSRWPTSAAVTPACPAPVAKVDRRGLRLGCGDEFPAASLRVGDLYSPADDRRVAFGMPAAMRLLAGVPLELNRVSAQDLALIPGVGAGLATKIVTEREHHGPFASLDALARVPGVGAKKLALLRPFLQVTPDAQPR
jgi:competence ComEA-like helix-hairpin-helix protein